MNLDFSDVEISARNECKLDHISLASAFFDYIYIGFKKTCNSKRNCLM